MPRLLLVEDHTLFRAGIRILLERSAGGHTIVGEAGDGQAAARLARELQPDIVLMDLTMPLMNGMESTRLILRECPNTRVIVLSMHADPAFVAASLDAGAIGYALKDAAFAEIEAAIRAALAGQKYLSPAVHKLRASGEPADTGPAAPALKKLSPRERQILQLIAEAFTSQEIAASLELSVRTVETYRQRMMDKLDIHSASALTAFAIRHGICSA